MARPVAIPVEVDGVTKRNPDDPRENIIFGHARPYPPGTTQAMIPAIDAMRAQQASADPASQEAGPGATDPLQAILALVAQLAQQPKPTPAPPPASLYQQAEVEVPAPPKPAVLPTDWATRKGRPIMAGVLQYFPKAISYVAHVSKVGNDQHNPGQPLHWDRTKSTDHAECILRHLLEAGTIDTDNVRHAGKVAWRALALLETELENAGE